ncbi:hypothetical protein [Nevskia ramosa]|uniref:hypothetical protein n=1 Tax=Nevskia ramosa TaxID=64002 RepID=UPI003D0B9D67
MKPSQKKNLKRAIAWVVSAIAVLLFIGVIGPVLMSSRTYEGPLAVFGVLAILAVLAITYILNRSHE